MRRFISAIAGAASIFSAAFAEETPSYQAIMDEAIAAFQAEDWQTLSKHLDAAQKLRPYSLFIWKNRILARQLLGRTDEALALADVIAQRGLSMDFTGHEGFEAFKSAPGFAEIKARMDSNMEPVGDNITLMQADAIDLLPEAYARDNKGRTYVGSIRTGDIIRPWESPDNEIAATALGGVFDIEIRGKKLWAVVNNQLAYKNSGKDEPFASVMVFNLKTGAPEREVRVAQDTALLGDLEVANNGTAYTSDSLTPRLFKMAADGDTLEIFAEDARFANLQGVALDEKHDRLFVADYLTGLFVIDAKTSAVTTIENTVGAHLGGIDGLYLYKDSLIGIQNGTTPQRIVRIKLNKNGVAVTGLEVLQQNLELWNEPTHGVVVKDRFEYIATSNWPAYDENGAVREGAELKPLRIMTLELKEN